VADQQQPPIRRRPAHERERLLDVEAAAERLVHAHTRPLCLAPSLRRELRRLAGPHPRTEQDRVECDP
jgi:hypothetical protein